jgi:hypothetical protein
MVVGNPASVVSALAEKIEQMGRSGSLGGSDGSRLRTGWKGFDDFLPGGGFRAGTTVEWLGDGDGSGMWSLALLSAARATAGRGGIVIFDRRGEFYPPGISSVSWGESCCVWVRSGTAREELWAWEQVLRSRGVAMAIGLMDGVSDQSLRRLARGAEQGETLGVWIRPVQARASPCWSAVRLIFESLESPNLGGGRPSVRRGKLILARARQGRAGKEVEVQWDEATGSLSVVSSLEYSAPGSRGASSA